MGVSKGTGGLGEDSSGSCHKIPRDMDTKIIESDPIMNNGMICASIDTNSTRQ